MGAQLMAIAAEGKRQRYYLPPNDEHEKAADVCPPAMDVPDSEMSHNPQATWNRLQLWHAEPGPTYSRSVSSLRLVTFTELVHEARE